MIHKDCYGTILLVWLICAPLAYLIMRFIPWPFISYPLEKEVVRTWENEISLTG